MSLPTQPPPQSTGQPGRGAPPGPPSPAAAGGAPLADRLERPLRSLRLSVTDRCNLRCAYCMPEDEYVWLPRRDLLTFEEMARLADVFIGLGVESVRLTGGEPLLRRDLPELIRQLAARPALLDIAMTTNGLLLAEHARALRDAGLRRVSISLDTLRPDRFRQLASRGTLPQVLAGLDAARAAGLRGTKLNTVVIRGLNDDELSDLIELGRRNAAEVRFIEYMDVGGATRWSERGVVSRAEMLAILERRYGPIEPVAERTAAPADRFRLPDGTVFGIIASTTTPFCSGCDRSRLTADGKWFLCLYAEGGLDLRAPLRDGASNAALAALIRDGWRARADRGAELRKQELERGALHPAGTLRANPHLEMHTRGG